MTFLTETQATQKIQKTHLGTQVGVLPHTEPVTTEQASMTPWWTRRELSSIAEKEAQERVEFPVASVEQAERRLGMCPAAFEVAEILGDYFGVISYGRTQIDASLAPSYLGYTCFAKDGKIHPKIRSFHIPNQLWVYDEQGHWLNPLTPCQIRLADRGVHQLFDIDEIKYDIWAIPVHENHICGGGWAWSESTCMAAFLSHGDLVNALFCMVYLPLHEAENLMAICERNAQIKGQFFYAEGDMAVATWLLNVDTSSSMPTMYAQNVRTHDVVRRDANKRQERFDYLARTSYEVVYNDTVKAWFDEGRRNQQLQQEKSYLAQVEESRALFRNSKLQQRLDQNGYCLSTAGTKAELYRERVELSPHRHPQRERIVVREFPISPVGLEMLTNFLTLHEALEKVPDAKITRTLPKDFVLNL